MKIQLVSPQILRITGDVDKKKLAALAGNLQLRMAEAFERMQTWAGRLLANDREYNVSKVLDGLDPRLGHRTGELQRAMYRVRAWTLRPIKGGFEIRFSDQPIRAAVAHAVYYIDDKVQGAVLMGIKREWIKGLTKGLARPARRSVTRTVAAVASVAVRRREQRTTVGVGR